VDVVTPRLLTDDDLAHIEHRMRRAGSANCWTGTSGTLAGDIMRLLEERKRLLAEIARLRTTDD
jgi:hypothetical protein